MKDKFQVIPTRISRGRKLRIDSSSSEEIWIEYEIKVSDYSLETIETAINTATNNIENYLDKEEEKVLNNHTFKNPTINSDNRQNYIDISSSNKSYTLEITEEGKELGEFKIQSSEDSKYKDFLHLRFKNQYEDIYIGYLLCNDGKFVFKKENIDKINNSGIQMDTHFKVILAHS